MNQYVSCPALSKVNTYVFVLLDKKITWLALNSNKI